MEEALVERRLALEPRSQDQLRLTGHRARRALGRLRQSVTPPASRGRAEGFRGDAGRPSSGARARTSLCAHAPRKPSARPRLAGSLPDLKTPFSPLSAAAWKLQAALSSATMRPARAEARDAKAWHRAGEVRLALARSGACLHTDVQTRAPGMALLGVSRNGPHAAVPAGGRNRALAARATALFSARVRTQALRARRRKLGGVDFARVEHGAVDTDALHRRAVGGGARARCTPRTRRFRTP